MKKLIVVAFFIGFMANPSWLVAQFSVSAELRPRAEMDNGAMRPLPDTVDTRYFVTQRTRLKFDLNREKYQMRLSLQDIRYWGSGDIYSATGVFGSTGGVDIQEAWFRIKLGENHQLTIGRQVLQLDDQRLIATRNWNQYGVAYDALAYGFSKDKWQVSAAVSYNTNANLSNGRQIIDDGLFQTLNKMKTMNYIHVRHDFSKELKASLMAVAAGYLSPKTSSVMYVMGTYGFWLKYDNKTFDVTAEGYYQNGKAQSGKDVKAYMVSLHPGIRAAKLRIGIGVDYFSGDNAENSDYGEMHRTFNKMYGAVFKYYGFMNQYTYMPGSTANGGLLDLYPNVRLPIGDKHNIAVLYHKFYLANPVMLGSEVVTDRDLGSEADLMYTFRPMKELMLQAGISYYFTTPTFKGIKGLGDTPIREPYWVWAMVTFTPNLFTTD